MRRCFPVVLVAAAVALGTAAPAAAWLQEPQQPAAQNFTPFTTEQLQQLVAPIALYADPLLAQVLLAATFPDEVKAAAEYVQANGTSGIDDQAWDVSVKAVAHYPTVLNLMNTRLDWTTSLGQAYAAQSTEVMAAVQHMRQLAQAQGNLQTTAQQQVVANPDYIAIWPAQPQYIYVPVYDPAVIFYRPVFYRPGFNLFFSWGVPFAIGPWLIYDWDWPGHRIYYTGWYGGGWIARSRPFIYWSSVYIHPSHGRVWYDRDVLWHHVDYGRVYPRDRGWRERGYYPGGRRDGHDGVRPGEGLAGARPTGRTAHPRDDQGLNGRTAQGLGPSRATAQQPTTPPQTYRQWGSQMEPPRSASPASPAAATPATPVGGGRTAQERVRTWTREGGWSQPPVNSGWSRPAEQVRPERGANRGWTPPATHYGNDPGVVVERGVPAQRGNSGGWSSYGGSRGATPRVERGGEGGRMSAPPQQRAPEQRPQQRGNGDQGSRGGAHRR